MASVHRTIVINRPINEVFAYFADVSNDQQWRGHGVKEITAEGAMRTGTHVRQKLAAGPFGAAVKADMDVVVYEPPTAPGIPSDHRTAQATHRVHVRTEWYGH